jgi:PAS domain S-box-containing protein
MNYKAGADHRMQGNDLYQKMFDEIQDYAIILMNEEGIIQNWNKGAQNIKLYTEEEIIGKHFSIFYLPEDLADHLPEKLLFEAKTTGRATHEGWRKRKDGTRFWGSVTITALHNNQGAIIGYSKVTRDLTDKKIVEDELRMSEERYHQMVAEVQDYAIILLSPAGIIENWNMGAEKIKGYTAREVIGKHIELFYTPDDRQTGLPYRLLNQAKEEGRAAQEGWRVRRNGTKFWGTIIITALHGKDNQVIGFSKVTRDLTQQKMAEEKILAYNAELQIRNGELEQFAYVASHDLQEPLRKIQTFTELIGEHYPDEERVKMYLKKLDTSAVRMSELIKSLLNYSRLAKDKEDATDVETVSLQAVVHEVKEDFELLIAEKKATIHCGSLPAVHGDRMQLGQLFSNLISNALKFSTAEPVITISSSLIEQSQIPDAPDALHAGWYHHILFEDNGIGFEQQYGKLIFSLFQRLHGKKDYAGTGIGLALCKKITENHGGFIAASGELNQGARFSVYLPL